MQRDKTPLETVRVVKVVACRCGATWTARIYLLTQALPLLPDTGTRGGRAGTDTVTPPRTSPSGPEHEPPESNRLTDARV